MLAKIVEAVREFPLLGIALIQSAALLVLLGSNIIGGLQEGKMVWVGINVFGLLCFLAVAFQITRAAIIATETKKVMVARIDGILKDHNDKVDNSKKT